MRLSALATRTVAATSALALSVVGFVALPGTAQASVTPVAPTVDVSMVWNGGSPQAVVTWSGATAVRTITSYNINFGVGATVDDVTDWNYNAVCEEGALTGESAVCHLVGTFDLDTDYTVGVYAMDSADSGIRGYGSVHVPATDPTPAPDPDPTDTGAGDPPVAVPPAAPTVIATTTDATSIAVTWSGAVGGDYGLDHYVVAWFLDGEEVGRDVTIDPAYDVTGLTTGSAYEVRVWTVDGSDTVSGDFASITATPTTPPDPDPSTTSPEPDPSTSTPDPDPSTSSPEPPASVDPVADGPFDAVSGIEATHDVLGNDPQGSTDPTVVTPPTHGAAFFDQDGLLHYTPADDYTGEDALAYAVDGSQVAATVAFDVAAYVPLTAPTSFTTTAIGPQSISVSWAAPEAGSTSPVDHYVVRWWNLDHWVVEDPTTTTSWTFTDLVPDTVYQFRVLAVDTRGIESSGDTWMEPRTARPTAPSAPTGLTATKTHDGSDVTDLSWDAATPGTFSPLAYVVEFRSSPDGDWQTLTRTSSTSATFDGSHLLAWDFRVFAVDPDNLAGTPSDVFTSDADPCTLPGYPDRFYVDQRTTTSLTWKWGAAEEGTFPIAYYVVKYRVQDAEDDYTVLYTDDLTATAADLLPGTTYDYSAETVDSMGHESGFVSASMSTLSLADVAPVGDEVTAYTQGTWFFDVLHNDNGSPTTATVVDGPQHGHVSWDGTQLQYVVDDNAATSDTFTYKTELSDQVATVTVTIAPVAGPSSPVITEHVADGQDSITVSWTASEKGSFPFWRYIVTWYKPGVGWQYILTTDTTVTIDGLRPGTSYRVDVMGEDTWANFSDSDSATVTTDSVPAPDAPTGLDAQAAGRYGVALTWNAVDPGPVASYEISYRIMGDEQWSQSGTVEAPATGTTVTGLAPDATYQFAVRACDADGVCSQDASILGSTEVLVPGASQDLVAEAAGTDSVDLTWSPSEGGNGELDGYEIWYRTVDGSWTWFDYIDATDTSATVTGLDAGTRYQFMVTAWDVDEYSSEAATAIATTDAVVDLRPADDDVSAYTESHWHFDVLANDPGEPTEATVVTPPAHGEVTWNGSSFVYTATDPDATEDSFTYTDDVSEVVATVHIALSPVVHASAPPSVRASATGQTTIDVAWGASTPGTFDLQDYVVAWQDPDGNRDWFVVDPDQLAATITGLDPDTDYIVTVIAEDTEGLLSDYGRLRYVTTDAPVPPSAPELVAEAAGTDSVDLRWSASVPGDSALDGYDIWYRSVDGDWIEFDYVAADVTSVTIDGLDAGTEYEFAITAYDVDEWQSEWAYASATTDADLPPAPVRPQITTPGAVVTGATATFEVSMVSDGAEIVAGDLAEGVSDVAVDGLTVTLTTQHGFSGRIVQPLLVTDGGDPVEVDATVLVDPDPATRATYRIVSATGSRITWTAGAGATGYVVKVGSTTVCTTAAATCLVPRVLGPASLVTVTATGHDETVGAAARATWASAPVNLGHVHFVGDSPRLTTASATQLRALAARLMAAGVTRVTVHGYTATQGRATRTPVQLRLSAMRANAVAAYLTACYTAHGKALRVVRVADGATHPIASNATSAGRAENRRAEVVLG